MRAAIAGANFATIASTQGAACALTFSGAVQCWGDGYFVATGVWASEAIALDCSSYFCVAVTRSGTIQIRG